MSGIVSIMFNGGVGALYSENAKAILLIDSQQNTSSVLRGGALCELETVSSATTKQEVELFM